MAHKGTMTLVLKGCGLCTGERNTGTKALGGYDGSDYNLK